MRRLPILLAFAAIYTIWGSTYLAIRWAIDSIPPLLMMSVRCGAAGLLLLGWSRLTSAAEIRPAHWKSAFIAGALLFLLCHGTLAWAEQRVASGEAALLSATTPLWIVAIDWRWGRRRRPGWRGVIGLAIGFAGVALLVGSGISAAPADRLASAAIVAGALAWAAGSIYGRHATLPADVRLATALQLIAGSVWLAMASGVSGEWVSVARPTAISVAALAYLVVFGSVIAFTAYVWLMRVVPASIVSTHAYVNPLAAVAIGAAVGGERIAASTIVAALTIVSGVILTLADRHQQLNRSIVPDIQDPPPVERRLRTRSA
jgi:drug/metabolite transporter (DMT)-like permease